MWALIVISIVAGVAHTDVADYNLTLDDCRVALTRVADGYCELQEPK